MRSRSSDTMPTHSVSCGLSRAPIANAIRSTAMCMSTCFCSFRTNVVENEIGHWAFKHALSDPNQRRTFLISQAASEQVGAVLDKMKSFFVVRLETVWVMRIWPGSNNVGLEISKSSANENE